MGPFRQQQPGTQFRPELQNFYSLRDECLARGDLFTDRFFPAIDESLFYSKKPSRRYEWKRPHEVSVNPQFIVDGASRFDINQGELGDCWLLASIASLTLKPYLFERVVPLDQDFGVNYAGIFHFRFWQYGNFVDVVIDDKLPTYNGQLVFLQSDSHNEYWSALLEKAYAKFYGSYETIRGGTTAEGMEDFTGGLTEKFQLMDKTPRNLLQIMLKAQERNSLLACAIRAGEVVHEAKLDNGLVCGHAYSITAIRMADIKTPQVSGKTPLLRIRNPWGNDTEWNGSWSDSSWEWQFIPQQEKEAMGLVYEADGEFWMTLFDFVKHFHDLEICHVSFDALDDEFDSERPKTWLAEAFHGSWTQGVTAGGCRNFLDTFWANPQYRVHLQEIDENDPDHKCTFIVALMQKNGRRQRKIGKEPLHIGFNVYRLENETMLPKPLGIEFFKYTSSEAKSDFQNAREVSCRFKLSPGTYCIVPSTYQPHEEGDFLLRVFSEKKNEMEELDDALGVVDVDERLRSDEVDGEDDTQAELFRHYFYQVAGDEYEIDAHGLKEALEQFLDKELQLNGFGIDSCRGMVALMDSDRSGKLGLEEFVELLENIMIWKEVFLLYDKDDSGSLATFELRAALQSAGYTLNWHVLKTLVLRYATKDKTISFEDFVCCAVKLKNMISIFNKKDKCFNNGAFFMLDEWIETTMYT